VYSGPSHLSVTTKYVLDYLGRQIKTWDAASQTRLRPGTPPPVGKLPQAKQTGVDRQYVVCIYKKKEAVRSLNMQVGPQGQLNDANYLAACM
jgi:hypothetical protein